MEQIDTHQSLPNPNLNKSFSWSDYFSFKHMIALQILQIIYILVAVGITFWGLKLLFLGGDDFGGLGRIGGFLLLVFGNIFWRLWCELVIVMFRINKTLNNIEENTQKWIFRKYYGNIAYRLVFDCRYFNMIHLVST